MSPPKAKKPRCNKSDLLSLGSLANKIHQRTEVADKKSIVKFVRGLVSTYLSCAKVNSELVKYRMLPECTGRLIGFQMLIPSEKESGLGLMFLIARHFKGMTPQDRNDKMSLDVASAFSLVERFSLGLEDIIVNKKDNHKVSRAEIRELISAPSSHLDICV